MLLNVLVLGRERIGKRLIGERLVRGRRGPRDTLGSKGLVGRLGGCSKTRSPVSLKMVYCQMKKRAREREREREKSIYEKTWSEMDSKEQNCVKKLGWTEESWINSTSPDETPFGKNLSDLPIELQKCAREIGIHESFSQYTHDDPSGGRTSW